MRLDTRSLTVTALYCVLLMPSPVHAQSTPSQAPAASTGSEQKHATHEYSLPPDKLKQAIEYSHARNWLAFGGAIYGIAVLLEKATISSCDSPKLFSFF